MSNDRNNNTLAPGVPLIAGTTTASNAPSEDPSAPPAANKARTKPITKEAKAELHAYFSSLNWPLNKQLPKGNFESDLKKIVQKYSLIRSQISRQLINYKKQSMDCSR